VEAEDDPDEGVEANTSNSGLGDSGWRGDAERIGIGDAERITKRIAAAPAGCGEDGGLGPDLPGLIGLPGVLGEEFALSPSPCFLIGLLKLPELIFNPISYKCIIIILL